MSFSPYIPNMKAWKEHFQNPPKSYKTFYTIGRAKQHGEQLDPIKLVTPTEMVVEQAKSDLQRERYMDDLLKPHCKRKPKTKRKTIVKSSSKRQKKK